MSYQEAVNRKASAETIKRADLYFGLTDIVNRNKLSLETGPDSFYFYLFNKQITHCSARCLSHGGYPGSDKSV